MWFKYSPEQWFESVWNRVEKTETCWLWRGQLDRDGYGMCYVPSVQVVRKAHRVIYEMMSSFQIPDGTIACHQCDNPPCVRPSHIVWGDHKDNMADKRSRRREARGANHGTRTKPASIPRGANHYKARLSPSLVEEIEQLAAQGWTGRAIAAKFNLGRSSVSRVLTGKSWVHLHPQGQVGAREATESEPADFVE